MKNNWNTRAFLIGIFCLTAFLVPIGVRANQPPPVTSVTDAFSYQTSSVVTVASCASVQINSVSITIPSGHSAWITPLTFGSRIEETGASNVGYIAFWTVNGTTIGQTVAFATTTDQVVAFGAMPTSASQGGTFISSSHAGPVNYSIAFYIQSEATCGSNTPITVVNPYLDVLVAQT